MWPGYMVASDAFDKSERCVLTHIHIFICVFLTQFLTVISLYIQIIRVKSESMLTMMEKTNAMMLTGNAGQKQVKIVKHR